MSDGRRTWRRPGWPDALLSGGDLVYELRMSSSEVVERLARPIRDERLRHRYTATGQLTGSVSLSRISLVLRKTRGRADFEGVIVEVPGGCDVVGTVKVEMAAFRVGFAIAWTVLAALGSVMLSVIVTHGFSSQWPSAGPPFPFALLFPAFGLVLLFAPPALERGHQEVLVRRLDALLGVDASAALVERARAGSPWLRLRRPPPR
jgi:hypothetical protein